MYKRYNGNFTIRAILIITLLLVWWLRKDIVTGGGGGITERSHTKCDMSVTGSWQFPFAQMLLRVLQVLLGLKITCVLFNGCKCALTCAGILLKIYMEIKF